MGGGIAGGILGAGAGGLAGGVAGGGVGSFAGPVGTLGGGAVGGLGGAQAGAILGGVAGFGGGAIAGNILCSSGSGSGGGGGGENGAPGEGDTKHGARRREQRGADDGFVENTKTGQTYTQNDGAKAYVRKQASGRYDVVIEGDYGKIVTVMKNKTAAEIRQLAEKYGWQ